MSFPRANSTDSQSLDSTEEHNPSTERSPLIQSKVALSPTKVSKKKAKQGPKDEEYRNLPVSPAPCTTYNGSEVIHTPSDAHRFLEDDNGTNSSKVKEALLASGGSEEVQQNYQYQDESSAIATKKRTTNTKSLKSSYNHRNEKSFKGDDDDDDSNDIYYNDNDQLLARSYTYHDDDLAPYLIRAGTGYSQQNHPISPEIHPREDTSQGGDYSGSKAGVVDRIRQTLQRNIPSLNSKPFTLGNYEEESGTYANQMPFDYGSTGRGSEYPSSYTQLIDDNFYNAKSGEGAKSKSFYNAHQYMNDCMSINSKYRQRFNEGKDQNIDRKVIDIHNAYQAPGREISMAKNHVWSEEKRRHASSLPGDMVNSQNMMDHHRNRSPTATSNHATPKPNSLNSQHSKKIKRKQRQTVSSRRKSVGAVDDLYDASSSDESETMDDLYTDFDPDFDVSTPHLLRMFNALDRDNNGRLTYDELRQGLSSMRGLEHISDLTVDLLIQQIDKDKSHDISQAEFVYAFQHLATRGSRDLTKDLVEMFVYDYGPDIANIRWLYPDEHFFDNSKGKLNEPTIMVGDEETKYIDDVDLRSNSIGGHASSLSNDEAFRFEAKLAELLDTIPNQNPSNPHVKHNGSFLNKTVGIDNNNYLDSPFRSYADQSFNQRRYSNPYLVPEMNFNTNNNNNNNGSTDGGRGGNGSSRSNSNVSQNSSPPNMLNIDIDNVSTDLKSNHQSVDPSSSNNNNDDRSTTSSPNTVATNNGSTDHRKKKRYHTMDEINVRWISITGIDATVLMKLASKYNLHPLQIEDALGSDKERMKIERMSNMLHIILAQLKYSNDEMSVMRIKKEQMSIFLAGDGKTVITLQRTKSEITNMLISRIMYASSKLRLNGADFLVYSIIDAVVDDVFPISRMIRKKLKNLHYEITSKEQTSLAAVHEIQELLRELNLLQIWISPLQALVTRLQTELRYQGANNNSLLHGSGPSYAHQYSNSGGIGLYENNSNFLQSGNRSPMEKSYSVQSFGNMQSLFQQQQQQQQHPQHQQQFLQDLGNWGTGPKLTRRNSTLSREFREDERQRNINLKNDKFHTRNIYNNNVGGSNRGSVIGGTSHSNNNLINGDNMNNPNYIVANDDIRRYLQDLVDHVHALKETLSAMTQWAQSLNDESFNEQQYRMNQVIYILTMITTVVLPAQFFTGLFGMNFSDLPLIHDPYGFYYFLALTIGFSMVIFLSFRINKWL